MKLLAEEHDNLSDILYNLKVLPNRHDERWCSTFLMLSLQRRFPIKRELSANSLRKGSTILTGVLSA